MVCPSCGKRNEWRDGYPELGKYVLTKSPQGFRSVMIRRKTGYGKNAIHWYLGPKPASQNLMPLQWMEIPE